MVAVTLTFADIFWAVTTVCLAFGELAVALLEERRNGSMGGALSA